MPVQHPDGGVRQREEKVVTELSSLESMYSILTTHLTDVIDCGIHKEWRQATALLSQCSTEIALTNPALFNDQVYHMSIGFALVNQMHRLLHCTRGLVVPICAPVSRPIAIPVLVTKPLVLVS